MHPELHFEHTFGDSLKMKPLSQKQNSVHEEILRSVANYRQLEWKIIELLQNAEACRLPKAFALRSLFEYATKVLKLDEARAYMLISLARKSKDVPSLARALKYETISAAKAARVVSIITNKNADELIEFAKTHTKREIEFEVARRNPRAAIERVRPVSEDRVEVTISMSKTEYENLVRVQSLEARHNSRVNMSESVTAAITTYLFYRDPVAKAQRNAGKLCPGRAGEDNARDSDNLEKKESLRAEASDSASTAEQSSRHQGQFSQRKPLTAAQRHAANFVSKGKCTYVFPDGSRCNQDRFVDIHHIVEVSRGGTNHPDNLRALCRFHHDLIHQKPHTVPTFEEWIEMACAISLEKQ
jgi:hypothetical protein